MNHLQDLHVLILGLGDSGLAMARWCHAHGAASVRVWDSRETPPQAAALAADVPGAQLFTGELTEASLGSARLVLKSPGLAPGDARIAPLLGAAKAQGIAVAGELGLFARALADLKMERRYAPKVIAITGTNGKTTTTSLTAQLVERAGKRVAVAGNIGPTLLDTLSAALAAQQVADEEAAQLAAPLPDCGEGGNPLPDNTWIPASAGMTVVDDRADSVSQGTETPNPLAEDIAEAVAADHDGAAEPAAADQADDLEPVEAALPADNEDAPLVLAPPPEVAPVFEHLPEVWVLELSSFQLDGVQGFEPTAATVLNITQDHLDWHGSMQAYAAAKACIFGESTLMVVNRDDQLVEAMVPAPVLVKGGRGKASKLVQRPVRRFGLDVPNHPSDFGLVTENGMSWLVHALPADETVKRRKDEDEEVILQRMMPAEALRIRGRHNASNALAALALAQSVGCPLAPMLHGLREYRGEPHRVELIGQVGGVEAFDDSKGTNVGATVAALNGLGADKLPSERRAAPSSLDPLGGPDADAAGLGARRSKLIVILGGDGKGQDFSPLAAPVAQHVRAFATIGRDAEAIEQALAATGVPFARHATLEASVPWCFAQAQPGDAVLLSPACASLDMFRNYAHRAEVFVSAVQSLAADRGEVLG
ncbi:MAG: UDP-N-acetylmuramoyl-L-alanine--D-glutamate ligase [Vitreoscilla sp.]|nr:UDP-N-acetylmuramoyl-L-alanine--D-glutamate ligase [Vitreoscilla sp.]